MTTTKEQPIQLTSGPRMELVLVTPQLAAVWLANNTHNRKISVRAVEKMAADMAAGLWREATSATICIARDGVLLDGQHRLMAVVRSGSAFRMWVMFDADPLDFQVIDIGGRGRRSTSDLLTLSGVAQASACAATAGIYLRMRDHWKSLWTGQNVYTASAIHEFVMAHELVMVEALSDATRVKDARIHQSAMAAVSLSVRLSSPSVDEWKEFVDQVSTGVMLTDDSPAFVLRRWASNQVRQTRGGSQAQQTWVSIISKAWNAHASGKAMRSVGWKRGVEEMSRPIPSPR